jgi:hypothetical protein
MTARLRPRIEIAIESLVLDGVPPSAGLVAAVQDELVRLLSSDDALDTLAALQSGPARLDIARLPAQVLGGPPDSVHLGARLGQALYRTLQSLGSAPPSVPAAPATAPAKTPQEHRS